MLKKKGRGKKTQNRNKSESKRDHMHGQLRLHVRIGNCTPRGIWVCRVAKWETPEQLGLHSQCTNISTPRRKWKQEGGGAEGEGYTDSSFTQNISPPRIVWKIRKVNASCLMENKGSNLKPSASNTCTLSLHLSVSVSWLILKHNPFGAPTCHYISAPSPHSGQFQVAAGWTGMFYFNQSDSQESSLWICSEDKKKKLPKKLRYKNRTYSFTLNSS